MAVALDWLWDMLCRI